MRPNDDGLSAKQGALPVRRLAVTMKIIDRRPERDDDRHARSSDRRSADDRARDELRSDRGTRDRDPRDARHEEHDSRRAEGRGDRGSRRDDSRERAETRAEPRRERAAAEGARQDSKADHQGQSDARVSGEGTKPKHTPIKFEPRPSNERGSSQQRSKEEPAEPRAHREDKHEPLPRQGVSRDVHRDRDRDRSARETERPSPRDDRNRDRDLERSRDETRREGDWHPAASRGTDRSAETADERARGRDDDRDDRRRRDDRRSEPEFPRNREAELKLPPHMSESRPSTDRRGVESRPDRIHEHGAHISVEDLRSRRFQSDRSSSRVPVDGSRDLWPDRYKPDDHTSPASAMQKSSRVQGRNPSPPRRRRVDDERGARTRGPRDEDDRPSLRERSSDGGRRSRSPERPEEAGRHRDEGRHRTPDRSKAVEHGRRSR